MNHSQKISYYSRHFFIYYNIRNSLRKETSGSWRCTCTSVTYEVYVHMCICICMCICMCLLDFLLRLLLSYSYSTSPLKVPEAKVTARWALHDILKRAVMLCYCIEERRAHSRPVTTLWVTRMQHTGAILVSTAWTACAPGVTNPETWLDDEFLMITLDWVVRKRGARQRPMLGPIHLLGLYTFMCYLVLTDCEFYASVNSKFESLQGYIKKTFNTLLGGTQKGRLAES